MAHVSNNFLIGSSLMKSGNVDEKLKELATSLDEVVEAEHEGAAEKVNYK